MKAWLAIAGIMGATLSLWGQQTGLPPGLHSGFEHFYNLAYDRALESFTAYVKENPNLPRGYNYVAQTILFRHMLKTGALESELVTGADAFFRRKIDEPSPEDQKQFDFAIQRCIELSEERLKNNPKDTEALYAMGIAYGLRGNYNFLIRRAWLNALRDATTARKLHSKVVALEPSRVDATLVQGLHEYVVGSLPWGWRLLGFLTGFGGNKTLGIQMVERVVREGKDTQIDAQILVCVIYRRERMPEKAIPYVQDLIRRFPRNYLYRMELAQMYSDLGKKREALEALEKVEELKRAGTEGYEQLPLEKIYFARGTIQFWYNDLAEAERNLEKVTAKAKELDLNTGTMSWMRLGQVRDLRGEREKAKEAYRQAIAQAPGSVIAEECRGYLKQPYQRGKKS